MNLEPVDISLLGYLAISFLSQENNVEDIQLFEDNHQTDKEGEKEENNFDEQILPDLNRGDEENEQILNQCNTCNLNFANKSNFNRHMKKHNEKMEACDICAKEFFTLYDLRAHIKSAHGNGIEECTVCNKTFKSQATYKQHEKLFHNKSFLYLCPHCGRGYNNKIDFESHKFGHEGLKPFTCGKCNKTFQHKGTRNQHASGCGVRVPKVKCEDCGKSFKKMKYLREHQKGHDDPEGFQCSSCGNYYKYRAGLFKHKKTTGHT